MDAKETTRLLTRAFGGAPRVFRFTRTDDEDVVHEVGVLVADGSPAPGFAAYGTVDAARFPTNVRTDDDRPIRTELVAAARVGDRVMSDVLASCAFAMAQGSVHVTVGAIIPNAVSDAVHGDVSCRHVLLVAPFLWPDLELLTDEGDEGVTTVLQAVPITRAELELVGRRGTDALAELLEVRGADVTNLDRPSVA